MSKPAWNTLTKRERQIVEIVYRLAEASVADVLAQVPSPPSYSALRATMGIMVDKGILDYVKVGRKYVYRPKTPKGRARRSALRHLVETFFDDSTEGVVAALLDMRASRLSDEELDRIEQLIRKATESRS